MYNHLRSSGYYVEVLGQPFTCFNASHYGTLLIVDPEEEYFPEEIEKLYRDYEQGLSILLFADWYNVTVMKKIKFFDENTHQWWLPPTGGANIPALNDLLSLWQIELGDFVYEGDFKIGNHEMYYASGTSIVKYPGTSFAVFHQKLNDQGEDILNNKKVPVQQVPILGFATQSVEARGHLAIYGDSNCLDSAHMQKDCFWLLNALLQYSSTGKVPSSLMNRRSDKSAVSNKDTTELRNSIQNFILDSFDDQRILSNANHAHQKPTRMENNDLHKYSKVIESAWQTRPLPICVLYPAEQAHVHNGAAPVSLHKSQELIQFPEASKSESLFDAPIILRRQNWWNHNSFDSDANEDQHSNKHTETVSFIHTPTSFYILFTLSVLFMVVLLVLFKTNLLCKLSRCKPKSRRTRHRLVTRFFQRGLATTVRASSNVSLDVTVCK